MYIGKFKPDDRDYAYVITGSSNFLKMGYKFEMDTTVGDEPLKSSGGLSNAAYIEKRLKDRSFKSCSNN